MKRPKGCLIPVGGAENKGTDLSDNLAFFELGILRQILNQIPEGVNPLIEVITTASGEPEDTFAAYQEGFDKLGCSAVGHINIRSRAAAEDPELLERLAACNCIMISGGDQLRLSSTFGGTKALGIMRERYWNEQFVIAGTSAGAMVMSNPMIYEGRAEKANLKGEVKIVSGFGLVDDVIIDTHVDKRGRFSRLAQAVAAQPGAIGIGLGEDTGILITKGHLMEVIGSSSIILIDGHRITCTNIAEISAGEPITVQNLTVHILAAGDRYDAEKQQFLAPVGKGQIH
jgi:cyanophycinase